MDPHEVDAFAVAAQRGDREAFRRLVEELQRELRIFLCARAADLELAEEVLQAAFVTAWERLGDYRPQGTFAPWLKGIARNLLLRELRERARHAAVAGDVLEQALADARRRHAEEEREPTDGAALRACLDRLSPAARTLIERRHRDGVPVPRLAQQFKRSAEAIAGLLKRIRGELRRCVQAKELAAREITARGVRP